MKKSLYLVMSLFICSSLLAGCNKKQAAEEAESADEETVQEAESETIEEEVIEEPEKEEEIAQPDNSERILTCEEDSFMNAVKYISKRGSKEKLINYAQKLYPAAKRDEKGKYSDNRKGVLEKLGGDIMKKLRFYRADKDGAVVDITVCTDPQKLMIDRIITEEFCANGREITDFYFEEGQLTFAYEYLNDTYGTRPDGDDNPGKKCSFSQDAMSGCVIDDEDVDFKKKAYDAADYGKMDEFTRAQYDELEADILRRAYITYDSVKNVPGYATISGYVGDEFGGYLSNVKLTLSSKAMEYELEFETNGDGYFETQVPINTADYYGVKCEYGDYTVSAVDDIDICPGTIEYSLGVIYMAEPGKGVHEANTYLLNANEKSPVGLKDGEYCAVFTYEDESAQLKPFSLNLEKKKLAKDPMTVIKGSDKEEYKYFVVDERGLDSGNPMTYELSSSRARVRIYDKNGLVASYQVPTGVAGTVWEVFEIKKGELIPLNNLLIETEKEPFLG